MIPTEHFSISEKVKHKIHVKSFTEMPIDHELVKRIWNVFICICEHQNVNYLPFFVESLYYFFDDLIISPKKDTPNEMNIQLQELFESVKTFMGVMQRRKSITGRNSSHSIDEDIFKTI